MVIYGWLTSCMEGVDGGGTEGIDVIPHCSSTMGCAPPPSADTLGISEVWGEVLYCIVFDPGGFWLKGYSDIYKRIVYQVFNYCKV